MPSSALPDPGLVSRILTGVIPSKLVLPVSDDDPVKYSDTSIITSADPKTLVISKEPGDDRVAITLLQTVLP